MGEFLLHVSGADRPVPWWVWPPAVLFVVAFLLGLAGRRG